MENKTTLVFATSNKNKIKEINKLLPDNLNIVIKSNKDMGILEDIPETGLTIQENAIQKATYVYEKYGYNCFSEDTGLIVETLNGEPGIYSARYAGEERDDNKNMQKILDKLIDSKNRNAHFKTVIALIIDGNLQLFEGIVEGIITTEKSGDSGFGYDPIFQPNGYNQTFAQIGMEEKNKISHRAKALEKLLIHLKGDLFTN